MLTRMVGLPESHRPGSDRLVGQRPVSRRAVLAATLLLPVIAACSGGTTPDPSPTSEDPDRALRARVAEQEATLIAAYEAITRQFPELAEDLNPILDQHRAHRAALAGDSASPTASPSATPAPTPASAADALATLTAAESAAADDCTTACVKCTGAETARLIALIAASEESHVPYLDGIVL